MATVVYSSNKATKRWLLVIAGITLISAAAWVLRTHPAWATKHPYVLLKVGWKAGKFVLIGLLAFAINWWRKRNGAESEPPVSSPEDTSQQKL